MNAANDRVMDITAEAFPEKVLERSYQIPVLVDFWAEWCAPCKMLMPILAGLAEKAGGKWELAKVNTDVEQALAQQYQVRSLPTVKLFRNGEPVDEFMGALPESSILEFIGRHVERESDQRANQAEQLFAAGDVEGALRLMDSAQRDDPENLRVVFRRLDLLLESGDFAAVEQGLGELPIALGDSAEARKLRAQLRFQRLLVPHAEGKDRSETGSRQQAAKAILEGAYPDALEVLIKLLQTNPKLDDGAPKEDLLAAFELISDPDLIAGYRRRMFNLLH